MSARVGSKRCNSSKGRSLPRARSTNVQLLQERVLKVQLEVAKLQRAYYKAKLDRMRLQVASAGAVTHEHDVVNRSDMDVQENLTLYCVISA